jgi:unspecific monooxygenase
VGPKEISISCYETGVRSVYNAGFDKPHYYSFYQYYGQLNSFASRSRVDHSACRRRVSAVYSKSYLFGSQPLRVVTEKILLDRLYPRLARDAQASEPTDLLRLSYALSLDLLNCFIFGLSSGPNFTQDDLLTQAFLEHYENRYCHEGFWSQELPFLTSTLGMLGIDMLPRQHYDSTAWIENWMMIHCNRAQRVCELLDKGELPDDPADIPIVYQQIRKSMEALKAGEGHDRAYAEKQTRSSIASELFDHMSGAREVFGLVLAYTIYYIASHPAEQSQLRSELKKLDQPITFPDNSYTDGVQPGRLASPQSLVQLTYLTAVIKESLRMRPNSTPLPRVTPSDHSVTIVSVEAIPPSTRVNCFQWFLHRDPEMWSRPDEWIPERWLREDGSEKDKMPPLWAFASGPRMCIGVHLTYYRKYLFMPSLLVSLS